MTTDTTDRPHLWPAPPSPKSGVKYDAGKPRWTLLPFDALEQVVAVLEYGARRYGVANWREIERPRERYLDALFRHAVAYARGETHDPETGLHHLAHAAVNALFIIWFDLCLEEGEQSDDALLRQALEALERGAWDTLSGRNAAFAIRERLGLAQEDRND